MKRFILVLFLVHLCLPLAHAAAGEFAVIGEQAPDFTLLDMQGEAVKLSEYEGKVVVLNFWATWCPPCRAEMPSMEELNTMFPADDFAMLAVNVERGGHDKVAAFLRDNPHNFTILLDDEGEVQRSYGVYRFPETFIIRRDGVIADKVIGAIDWTEKDIVNFLRFLIKG